MIKVSVVGAKGRMGSHVVDAVNNADDTELALALDAGDDLAQITPDNTDVVVEFTVPSVSLDNVLALVAQGVDVVVGTTGWTEEKLDQVRAALAAAPREGQSVFIAPNFAISAGARRLFRQGCGSVLRIRRSDRTAPPEQGGCSVRHRIPYRAGYCRSS